MRIALRVVLLLGATILYTLFVALSLLFVPKREKDRFRARHQQIGSKILCRIFGIRIVQKGRFRQEGPTLIVCNHFGILDPFILATTVRTAFVAKSEIQSWPLIGWVARVYGVIFVYRDRKHTVADFVRQVRERMRSGVPVLVFPEGTTSADETVFPFKTGSFAAVSGMHEAFVQPVYLRPTAVNGAPVDESNRRSVTWAGENEPFIANLKRIIRLRDIEMEVDFGRPIPVSEGNRKQLAEDARSRVIALRDRKPETDTFLT